MTVGLLLVVAMLKSFAALALAAVGTLVIVGSARVRRKQLLVCLVSVNLFMLLLAASMPWSHFDEASHFDGAWFSLGPWGYTPAGLEQVARIAIRANVMVLATVALIGTLEPTLLGRACRRLHMPDKLIHLLLFMVRYLEVLKAEYHRLLGAAKLRGFRPALNRHTLHTFGQLAGMLLVRSIDRSERILSAMKCRGFSGRFYLLDQFRYTGADLVAAVCFMIVVTGLVVIEWI